jgi:hypothetical protein
MPTVTAGSRFPEGLQPPDLHLQLRRLVGMCSIKPEDVRVASSELAHANVIRCDVCIMPVASRPLPLLSCNRTDTQECEHYRYNQCHDNFGGEFHHDYVFCSDAFSRNSFNPPPELKEAML